MYFNGGKNQTQLDLTDKIIIVTGANAGIGKETTLELVKLKATVIMACRSAERTKIAMDYIQKSSGRNNFEFMQLDLSDLESVQNFVKNFKSKYNKLDILINNAGMLSNKRENSKQNFELTFASNHLGHFLLTQLLMDSLKKSDQGRIINVSSEAYKYAKIDFSDLQLNKNYKPFMAYSISKLINVYFTKQLAQELEEKQISNLKTVSLHPGAVRTEIIGKNLNNICYKSIYCIFYPVWYLLTKSEYQGAQTTLTCALQDFSQLENGAYYQDCKVTKQKLNQNWQIEAKKIYEISDQLVKNYIKI